MYCSRCGQAISTQPYCPNCGAPTGLGPTAGGPGGPGFPVAAGFPGARVARHLHTLGILWVAFSVYLLLQWLLVWPFLHAYTGGHIMWMHGGMMGMNGTFHPGGWLLHLITVIVAVRVILSLGVGIALLTRQPWGRIYAVVIAVLTLLKPIVGTVLAIYTLWVLLSRNAGQEYENLTLSRELHPL